MARHGEFVWNELSTHDPERAKRFFAETVSWTFQGMPMAEGAGTYWVARAGDTMAAGIFDLTCLNMPDIPEHWTGYLEVDDVDARVAQVEQAGGTILRAPWSIPKVGRIALVQVPGGAVMGWMTSERM